MPVSLKLGLGSKFEEFCVALEKLILVRSTIVVNNRTPCIHILVRIETMTSDFMFKPQSIIITVNYHEFFNQDVYTSQELLLRKQILITSDNQI